MTCGVCNQEKPGLNWVSASTGSYLICADCAQPFQTELRAILERFKACDTIHALLEELFKAAIDVTRADKGNVQLADAHGVLRIHAQVGFETEFLDFFSAVEPNEAACGTAAANRRTVIVADIDHSPIFLGTPALEILRGADVRAVQSTPIFGRSGALIGIVSTHFRQAHAFTYHELDLVGHLAAYAAERLERFAALQR